MFSSLGLEVTLVVSRQQVLPAEGPRGRRRARGGLPAPGRQAAEGGPGRRASSGGDDGVTVRCDDGRRVDGCPRPAGHRLDAEHRGPRPRRRRRRGRRAATSRSTSNCHTNVGAHLRRRRPVGEAAAVVGGGDAGPQDRRARDGPAHPGAPPPRLRQGGLGHLHRARDRRRRAWPRPTPSPSAARSGSPRCRSRPTPRR